MCVCVVYSASCVTVLSCHGLSCMYSTKVCLSSLFAFRLGGTSSQREGKKKSFVGVGVGVGVGARTGAGAGMA